MSLEQTQRKADTLLGRTICGCEILDLISEGGMGKLYRGRQLSLGRIVAVKVLSPALSANHEFLVRFRREARSLGDLLHPNIVTVHDFGEEDEIHCIVMEYVEGKSVADMLVCDNVIALPAALDIVRQVAEGLACAHEHHIIHCDLKPENILVTPRGVAKVVDFGLAKSLRGDAVRVTQSGAILGTPTYMSPEQCEGAPLDARTDIYSLGATFYRIVAGRDAFEGSNAFAIMLKHENEPVPDPRRFNPSLPAAVVNVILRMLEKTREERYQGAAEVAQVLAALEKGEPSPEDATEGVEYPRHELGIARQAIEAGLVSASQLREVLALQKRLEGTNADEGLPTLMIKRGLLTEEQARQLAEQSHAREEQRSNEHFGRLALEAGLATREQIDLCVRRRRSSRGVGAHTKLSKMMVKDGLLKPEEVVELLLCQLKEAQHREDAEFLELIRRQEALREADIERCVQEQKRQEAEGRPKVLRQIVLELGLLPGPQLKALLRRKVREDIEQALSEWEATEGGPAEAIMPDEQDLRLKELEPCPACGEKVEVRVRVCPSCGREVEKALREVARRGGVPPSKPQQAKGKRAGKTRLPTGQWEIRLPGGEPSRKLAFAALIKLAREKRLMARTVLRGPLTSGVWRQARHIPKLCRLFGTCHYCEGKLPPNAKRCPICDADPDRSHDH